MALGDVRRLYQVVSKRANEWFVVDCDPHTQDPKLTMPKAHRMLEKSLTKTDAKQLGDVWAWCGIWRLSLMVGDEVKPPSPERTAVSFCALKEFRTHKAPRTQSDKHAQCA